MPHMTYRLETVSDSTVKGVGPGRPVGKCVYMCMWEYKNKGL